MSMRVVAVMAMASWASAAVAADAAFENHLQSSPMVSPAQLYQIDEVRTDASLGYLSNEGTAKPDGGDEMKGTATGTDLFAAGIYNVKGIGLRAGLSVWYGSMDSESEQTVMVGTTPETMKVKSEGTSMVLTPQAAMPVGPVVIGAALDVVQDTAKPEDGDTAKGNYTTFRPGVLFNNSDMEAGATFATKTKIKAEDTDEIAEMHPSIFTAHGRYAVSKEMAFGGIFANENWSGIDKDAYKNRSRIKATGEFGMGAVKVEGDLGYNTAFYKSKDAGFGEDTISTMELGAAADYSVNKDLAVGGALGYEFGSDKSDAMEVATNEMSLAVRGNMKF